MRFFLVFNILNKKLPLSVILLYNKLSPKLVARDVLHDILKVDCAQLSSSDPHYAG